MMIDLEYEQSIQGIDSTLTAVKIQRVKQLNKWGTQDHNPKMWVAILGEEYGEVCKEVAETHVKDFDPVAYREECLHVAAVALAMVQNLDDGIA
jgi:hypothetical protein